MIGDLLKLKDELVNASDEAERKAKQAAFLGAIRTEVAALLNDPKYPENRRSFGAIRKRMGFEDEDEQKDLRGILRDLGLRVHRGEGDEALWEWPEGARVADRNGAPHDPPPRPLATRLALAAIVVAIVLFAANALVAALTETSLVGLIRSAVASSETHATCVESNNGVFVEILKCHTKFGLLQRP